MNWVARTTLEALESRGSHPFRDYRDALVEACRFHPPPFGEGWYGELYRHLAVDPAWMVHSLLANARKEAEGARTLWKLAGSLKYDTLARQVKRHALDESRHAKLYVALLNLAFPQAAGAKTRKTLTQISPGLAARTPLEKFAPKPDLAALDEIIQMNIGEIRTRIHQLLMRPVLHEWCPQENRPRLKRVLDNLLFDETSHIFYTARIIEDAAKKKKKKLVTRVMCQRLKDFNSLTLQEVGRPEGMMVA